MPSGSPFSHPELFYGSAIRARRVPKVRSQLKIFSGKDGWRTRSGEKRKASLMKPAATPDPSLPARGDYFFRGNDAFCDRVIGPVEELEVLLGIVFAVVDGQDQRRNAPVLHLVLG